MAAPPTRIKISINGISSGSLLKIGESVGITSKEELVAEAARRLMPEADAAAVDPAAGELYLDGGFDVPTLNELDKDDHVFVAFNGSPFKEKRARADTSSLSADTSTPASKLAGAPRAPRGLTLDEPPDSVAMLAAPMTALTSLPPPPTSRVALSPISAPAGAAGGHPFDLDDDGPDEMVAEAGGEGTGGDRLAMWQQPEGPMDVDEEAAGARLSIDEMLERLAGASDFEGFDVHVVVAAVDGTEVERTATLVKRRDGWRLETRLPRVVVVEGASLDKIKGLVRDGKCLPSLVAPPPSSNVPRSVPASRRTPEAVQAARQKLIDDGLVIVEDPRIAADRRDYDMVCVCCDVLLIGTKKLSVVCGIVVKGTGTRFDTILFGQHCGTRDHLSKCSATSIEPMPAVLAKQRERKGAGTLASTFARASASSTSPAGPALAALPHATSAPTAALVVSPPPGGALVAVACRGALRGDRYLGLAHSAGVRTKVGASSDVIPETYGCSLENDVPVVRALGCSGERATSSPCVQCKALVSGTIIQRADRRRLTVAKVEMLELILQNKPATEGLAELLSKETTGGKKKEGEQKLLLMQATAEEQKAALVATLSGMKGQLSSYTPAFAARLELLVEREKNFTLILRSKAIDKLPTSIKVFIADYSKGHVAARQLAPVLSQVVAGAEDKRLKAQLGLLMDASERLRRVDNGSSGRMSGSRIPLSAVNLLLGFSQFGKKAFKFASKNLLGYEIKISNLTCKISKLLNLPEGVFLELIDPSDEQLDTMIRTLLPGFVDAQLETPPSPLLTIQMDPTKLPGALEWCPKRNAVLGGDALISKAKVPVSDGKSSTEFIEDMGAIVPSDQINILSMCPQAPGYPIVEVAGWPERHSRSKLPDEQKALLGPASTSESVFKQGDRALAAIVRHGGRIVSFGCDGGVHGMAIIESLHSTTGPKLQIVAERKEESITSQLLVGAFSSLKLVSCKTTRGQVVAGILDPDHILKRQQDQEQSGVRFLVCGPERYCSYGFWAACGVPQSVIVKPDPMSDDLTREAHSSAVMQMLLTNAPEGIDPTGTIVWLFCVGEMIDAVRLDGFSDLDAMARLVFGVAVLTGIRQYVLDQHTGCVTNFAMALLPLHNLQKMAHGFQSFLLNWLEDLADEPRYLPAHGSIRLETGFSVRCAKADAIGVLGFANEQLKTLMVNTLVAKGELKEGSTSKGYVSREERKMKPAAYEHSPRSVLETVMLATDQCARQFLEIVFKIALRGGKAVAAQPGMEPDAPTAPLDDEPVLTVEEEIWTWVQCDELAEAATLASTHLDPGAHPGPPADEGECESTAAVLDAAQSAEAAGDAEGELQELARQVAGKAPILAKPRGRGASASIPCTHTMQLSSTWLERLRTAVDAKREGGTDAALCQVLVDMRAATERQGNAKVGTKVRTPEEAAAAAAAHEHRRGNVRLQGDGDGDGGESLHPATALKLIRKGQVETFFSQKKQGRLARWMKGSSVVAATAGLADDATTIQAGECWVYLQGEDSVGLALVVSAAKSAKGGHRPEADRARPHLLKECSSVGMVVFGKAVPGGDGSLFLRTAPDFTRSPRRMISKLLKGEHIDLSQVVSDGLLKVTQMVMVHLALATAAAPAMWQSLQS